MTNPVSKKNPYRQLDEKGLQELYKYLRQKDENKKWRKKHKEPNQLTIESAIRKAEVKK